MANPFDQFDPDQVGEIKPVNKNPFAKYGEVGEPDTSATGAFSRGVVRGVVPAVGGIAGAAAGAEAGAFAGLGGGPFAWATVPAGAIVGGLAGAYLGSTAAAGAQHYALSKAPDKWREAIGLDDRQERLDEAGHPIASFLGGLAPYAVTMNPMSATRAALPANATAMQRIMSHPATARVFGGGAMGGMELGQEAIGPEPIDWRKVAISTGMGVVLNRPNRIGERIGEWGAAPTRSLLRIPSPEVVETAPRAPAAAPVAPVAEPAVQPAPAHGIAPTLFHAVPTVAQAADLRVMGPGVTEEVFHGSHEANPVARMAAQETARIEAETIGAPPAPDLHSIARRSTPDLFNRYDELQGQRRDLEAAAPENPHAQAHLAAVEREIADLEPQVAAAYRRAGEVAGAPIVPHPEPVAHSGRPIEEQRAFIADDVARQLVRAGRPADEAAFAGQLVASRYEARASQFAGVRGSAEDMYRADAAEILGPGMRSRQPAGIPQPRGPRQVNERALSLFQFLAHRGGIAPHPDVQHALGENPFVPGFGRLIRQGGMSLDRAREAAVEAGYLHDQGAIEGRGTESTINQLLEAIGEESRGNKLYRAGHRPEEGAAEHPEPEPEPEGGAGAAEPVPSRRSELMTQEDEEAIAELFQRKRAGEGPNLFAEREAEGQTGLPGAERISEAELAQRRANEALKPTVAQKPMDVGLFGDEKGQKELFQRDQTAPPFYSAVGRAVETAKQEKASADQWLATIKNTPGVKAEEMEWLGLADWLKGQKGAVTKQQIADYIRANSIEVREVEKGTTKFEQAVIARARELGEAENGPGSWERIGGGGQEHYLRDARRELRTQFGGEEATPSKPKFASYQLPGGENYRELLLTLPETGADVSAIKKPEPITSLPEEYHLIHDAHGVAKGEEWGVVPEGQTHARGLTGRYYATQEEATQRAVEYLNYQNEAGFREQINAANEAARSKDFRASHWGEPNVLAHVRFNDRVIDGKHTLFIEEVQSDWHQQGRRKGYRADQEAEMARLVKERDAIGKQLHDLGPNAPYTEESGRLIDQMNALHDRIRELGVSDVGVPDAPFKTSWPELSLKRMIRYAAEHGYEQVAWTPGKVQAERYDLSQHIKEIEYVKNSDGTYRLGIADKDGEPIRSLPNIDVNRITLPQIEETVGKEIAEKIKNEEGRRFRGHDGITLENVDLKVGGEGMLAFYDKMLPAAANKLVKKFGAKVGEGKAPDLQTKIDRDTVRPDEQAVADHKAEWDRLKAEVEPHNKALEAKGFVGGGSELENINRIHAQLDALHTKMVDETVARIPAPSIPVHTLPLPDALREAAIGEGFPLFQGARGKIRLQEGRRPIITLMADANASTFIHETGHEWLEQLMRDAEHQAAPDPLRADAATTLKWLGVEHYDDIGRREHEKFARGFEQYLREGIAPSPGLASVFARFKTWLVQIYQTLKGLGTPISDDIRRVFDRMIVAEPHGTVIAEPREVRPSLADIHEIDAAETIHTEADAVRDRVAAEADRYYADLPEEIRLELEARIAEKAAIEAEGGEPGQGLEPPGETGPGGGEGRQVVEPRGGPEVEPGGGGGGIEPRAIGEGGTGAERQGAASPRPGERPGGAEERGNAELAPAPAARFAPGDDRTVDLAGNIRVENLTSVDGIAQAIHESAERNGEFQSARGSMTKGQMMDLADAMGLEPDNISEAKLASLLGGTANLAPRILAARKLVVDSAAVVSEAMKRAATGADEEVAALAVAIARHDLIQGALAGATAEWGRAGSAFHSLLSGWGEAEKVNDFLKQNTGRTLFQLKQIAKLGTQLDTPGKVSKYLRDAQNRSFGGMILEYWINGLISGPATHTTYMIGNAILAAEKAGPETAAAALIGSLRKAMGREGETVRLGEVGAQFRAAGRALPAATEAAIEAFRTGLTTLLPGEAGRPLIPFSGDTSLVVARAGTNAPVSWADVGAQAFGTLRGVRDGLMSGAALIAAGGETGAPLLGLHWSPLGQMPDIAIRGVPAIPVGTAFRLPGRFIAAIHSFFRATNYAMEKGRLAYRTAANEGLTGTAFDARVGDLWQNPPEAMMEQSRGEATELTLMGQGGAFVKALSAFMNAKVDLPVLGKFAPLKFIDPFVHIGANVINQSIVHRSPVGVLSAEIRADLMGKNGNVAQDTAMARMLVGTALSIGFGGLAAQGFASGSGPKDPKEAAMWKLAGNQAHSVRIGDIWIDVHRLGPMGMLMGIAADMQEVGHQLTEAEYTEAAAHFQHAVTQNVLDESFMRGPAELMRAVEDPCRYGDAYIRNHLASFVPFSVGMAQLARAADPYSRQTRTVLDAMIDKIPGYSQTLYPRRDIWGEPLPNRTTIGPQGFLALWAQQVSTDPVNLAMTSLGVSPAQVPRKIRNVDLDDAQYDDFARIAGRMTKMRLDVIVKSPDWRTWPNHVKVDVMQEVLKQSREVARGVMMMKYPSIARDATAAKLEKLQD
jgi:hypothetical protein